MERKELVATAISMGIKNAHTIKSVVLEEMIKIEVVKTTGKRGRPVNPNSVRQVRINELETKRANGELRLGRPVNPDSVRQARLTELETKRANGELKLGRPVNNDSARQKRLAEMEAKRASGELRRGRPKKVTDETAS